MHKYMDWPGKSDKEGNRHTATCHMLDVAACAEQFIKSSVFSALSPNQKQALLFLVTLHDLGKISTSFRNQIERQRPPQQDCRHWQLSFFLLNELDDHIAGLIGGGSKYIRSELYAAIAGHHGRPPANPDRSAKGRQKNAIGEDGARETAKHFIEDLKNLYPDASLEKMSLKEAKILSWLLSGLTVLSDWIGSNGIWFPVGDDNELDIRSYYQKALKKAERAVKAAGLLNSGLRDITDYSAFTSGYALRPMQQAVADAQLPEGPVLAFINDSTGAGKTEAALILACKMLKAGKGKGLYFGLPTMATSDAMFERLKEAIALIFDGLPSLALIHGKRHLSDMFREIRGSDQSNSPDAGCAEWLADDRRLSLLAEIGVGTIDQILMSILPTKFNSLRMWALCDHVVIIDEAHSYDSYMEKELERFLELQARFGGSVIIMTATLPKAMRDHYIQAFQRGLPESEPEKMMSDEADWNSYPALSLIGKDQCSVTAVEPLPELKKNVSIKRHDHFESFRPLLAEYLKKGAACLWVRNAVDDAIQAYHDLKQQGFEVDLLHARYAMADRKKIEETIRSRYGKEGKGRAGRILVSTQIVESSLDLDFDCLISDLAPIEALIQRAGRLWRHMDKRPAAGRPLSEAILYLLSPDPFDVRSERWLHQVLDMGAYVYPQDVQWRTARLLSDYPVISIPDDLITLIETVHGDNPPELPQPLSNLELISKGKSLGERHRAGVNSIEPDEGYRQEGNIGYHENSYLTRLGEEQVTLVLLRNRNGNPEPWAEEGSFEQREALSEVRFSKKRLEHYPGLKTLSPDLQTYIRHYPEWKKQELDNYERLLVIVPDNGIIAEGCSYDPQIGLQFTRI